MADPIQVITAEQLIAYPGAGSPSQANAEFYTDLVNELITEGWVEPVDPVPTKVKAVALEAAGRASRNPKGLISWTKSVDDGSRTERVAETAARVGVYLTADEWADINGARRTRRRRYGTIRVGLGF